MFGSYRVTDPLVWVQGDGSRYACPTIESVLLHLRAVRDRIKDPDTAPRTRQRLQYDLDVLLDRLLYLKLTDG